MVFGSILVAFLALNALSLSLSLSRVCVFVYVLCKSVCKCKANVYVYRFGVRSVCHCNIYLHQEFSYWNRNERPEKEKKNDSAHPLVTNPWTTTANFANVLKLSCNFSVHVIIHTYKHITHDCETRKSGICVQIFLKTKIIALTFNCVFK